METSPIPCLDKVYGLIKSDGRAEDITYFDVSRPRYERVLSRITKPGSMILDVGCAPGHLAMACSLSGHTVHAIDLNREYDLKYLSQDWILRLNRIVHNIEKEPLPYPDRRFDIVLFCDILEHIAIRHPVEILKELARVLRSDGELILTTPNVANITNCLALYLGENVFWKPEMFYGSTDRHNREYTPNEVEDLIKQAGLEIKSMEFFDTHSHWNTHVYDRMIDLMQLVASSMDCVSLPDSFLHSSIIVCATPGESHR